VGGTAIAVCGSAETSNGDKRSADILSCTFHVYPNHLPSQCHHMYVMHIAVGPIGGGKRCMLQHVSQE
jgi:hypothetical protein